MEIARWPEYSGNAFLAAHLLSQGFDDEDDLILRTLRVTEEDAQAAADRLTDPTTWPVLDVPFAAGARVAIVYRNVEDDNGVDYAFSFDTDRSPVRLTSIADDFFGPGLSWAELRESIGPMTADSARRLLFLAPMAGGDAGTAAIDQVSAALRVLGDSDVATDRLAAILVEEHPMWESPTWTVNEAGVRICDGAYSPRNPQSAHRLDPATLVAVSTFLHGQR